jgi:hypothetical protein
MKHLLKKYKNFPGKNFLQTLLLGTCFSKWKRLLKKGQNFWEKFS